MKRCIARRQFLCSGLFAGLSLASIRSVAASADGLELSAKLQHFLWRSQADDGSWPSGKYGVLRSGQALTPFVLMALIDADRSNLHSPNADRAVAWIGRHLREGCLGVADPEVLEYPVFATAFALRVFAARENHPSGRHPTQSAVQSHDDISAMRRYLLGQQFTEARGFDPDDLAYGGWGFGGEHPPGQTGHMDLSHVRWTLQALSASDTDSSYAAGAQRFLRLLQKHPSENRPQPIDAQRTSLRPPFDGGFYFSPIVLRANKGRIEQGADKPFFRSYATATCDGLLALLAAGVDRSDDRVIAARQWLQDHSDWEYPEGIPRDHPEPWGDAVHFYHQAVRAEVYRRMDVKGNWRQQLLRRLRQHQRDVGSIINQRSSLMKEDDPILCSTLALMAANEAIRGSDG